MKLVAGLGNPGRRYAETRHNVGFAVIDELARAWSCTLRCSLRYHAWTARTTFAGEDVLLVKPRTFMNLSGTAIAALVRGKGMTATDVIVVSDDADLEVGRLRLRRKGSSGGHRGLASIIQDLGSEDFARVRVGIGRQEDAGLVDFVLAPFTAEERKVVGPVVKRASEAVQCILESGIETAMNRYN